MASNSARATMDAAVTEDAFLLQVIELARLRHWLVHHCRPARTRKGWATPIQGDPGFPDLVLVSDPDKRSDCRLIFAELKSQKGKTTHSQNQWARALRGTQTEYWGEQRPWEESPLPMTPEVYLWRPSDWATVEEVLR